MRKHQPLRPSDISPGNYLFWAGKYNVAGITPPPPRYKIVAMAVDASNLEGNPSAASEEKLKVPPGYRASRAYLTGNRGGTTNADWRVYIGRNEATNFNFPVTLDSEDEVVPIALVTVDVWIYAFTVEVECERSPSTYEAWQFETYTAIFNAYQEQLSAHHERLASLRAQRGISIRGRNPLVSKQFIDAELKRSSITILTAQHFDGFDSISVDPTHGVPEVDLARIRLEGPFIRFFEQAFEWENMVYLFYPYYWGRKETWPAQATADDGDPLFGQFLRAGAARVVVPVRPTFEGSVCTYLSTGWPLAPEGDAACAEDGDMPFLSIIDEMKASSSYSGQEGPGTISVTNGSAIVQGADTEFEMDKDTDRVIYIRGMKYRIRKVVDASNLELDVPYAGATEAALPYSLGPRYVGAPWEVRVPTSLVHLQADSEIPGIGGSA